MKFLPFVLLIFSIFLESTIFSWPLVLGMLILLTALYKAQWVLGVACVSGIVLDILTFHFVGSSSLFFLIILGLVFLYQRKFEIESPFFVGISVLVGSLIYSALFIHQYSFLSAVMTAIFVSIAYVGLALFQDPKKSRLV